MLARSLGLPTKGVQRQDWSPYTQDFNDLADMQVKFCDMIEHRGEDDDARGIRAICFYEKLPITGHKLVGGPVRRI